MERKEIIGSKNIKSIGYDTDTKELQVEFLHGGLYAYDEVPPELHEQLMAARSKGEFFHAKIRKGDFKYRKLK